MQNNAGFTLIEVLIALVILSIALTAMIKATSQHIQDTIYIQNKMTANWVGVQVINEVRAGIIKLPVEPGTLKKHTAMLGRQWQWEANLSTTPNPHIKKISVDVSLTQQTSVLHLESYLYAI